MKNPVRFRAGFFCFTLSYNQSFPLPTFSHLSKGLSCGCKYWFCNTELPLRISALQLYYLQRIGTHFQVAAYVKNNNGNGYKNVGYDLDGCYVFAVIKSGE